MNDKSIEHMKRLLIFKERLIALLSQNGLTRGKFVDRLNARYDYYKYDESTIKTYCSIEQPKEPNIVNAVDMARALDVDLYYLFGLDQGELIYSPIVGSLLVNLFRAFTVDGIEVKVRRISKETIIIPTSQHFNAFFDEIDLQRDFTFNKPILEKTIQSFKEPTRRMESSPNISSESLYPHVTENEMLKNFKSHLHSVMKDDGVSTKELAERTQLSSEAIEDYLYGKRGRPNAYVKMGVNSALDIACSLDVSLEYLLGLHKDRQAFRIMDTPESVCLNLFKALQSANFKMREDSDHGKVAYTENEFIYLFFKQITSFGIKSAKGAAALSKEVDDENLWVANGEIQLRDRSIEKSGLEYVRFLTENSLYSSTIEDQVDQKTLTEIVNKLLNQ